MIDLVTEAVPPLGLARYGALFRVPHVRRLVLSGMLARLPAGMIGLALLLLVRENGGSYAAAGVVSGGYFVATAIGAPIAGRRVDRRGQARILLARGVIFPALLAGVCALALLDAPLALVGAAAAAAGALMPPIGASLRSLWPRMFADAELRAAAYALEASLQEITFIVGPLLVALLTAAVSPVLALGRCSGPWRCRHDADRGGRARAGVAARGGAAPIDPGRARVAWRRDADRPVRVPRPRLRRHGGRLPRVRRRPRRRGAREHPALALRGRQPRRRARGRCAGHVAAAADAARLRGRACVRPRAAAPRVVAAEHGGARLRRRAGDRAGGDVGVRAGRRGRRPRDCGRGVLLDHDRRFRRVLGRDGGSAGR